ncbi:hypothetical protein AQUCO_00100734v1 [Aquilegia coerulea]|uniref:RecF/RecN/SMC N-terminal domain-containing protein n=1 Tax=Aquilegia coerulea TaxID=218851 RepID=A0A2G5FBP3_AQUCA|nr:hypothetical protein AQUCO_00100734v1 [Aquilegia coerulea]
MFQILQSEDRRALRHEDTGHQVLSAFVEIVLDNFDNHIPVEKEEVRLRRTFGLKKEMNILESARFTRSNPYYVVQQGKITTLTLMKDSERLDLLKEIGGTCIYEERRQECLKIMQEIGNKRKQIFQVVQYLDERLRELAEEKDFIESQNNGIVLSIWKPENLSNHQIIFNHMYNPNHKPMLRTGKELNLLQKKIQDSSDELETVNLMYKEQVAKEEEITKGIMEREKQLSVLYQKEGCPTEFSSEADRDK